MRALITTIASVAALTGLSAPVAAQDAGGEKVNQLIIYGDDVCPQGSPDEIVICARKDEGERFRIPEALRESSSPQNEAWTNRVLAYEMVGRSGTMSCSPSGAGGWTGCAQKLIDTAYAEKREGGDIRFSELIAAERARRLSTLDADAAETQKRVEALEKEYMERQRQKDDAAAAQAETTQPPLPEPR